MFSLHLAFLLTISPFLGSCFSNDGQLVDAVRSEAKEDGALFLTPYIERGQIKEALQLATVEPVLKNIESFSGFLTVNKTTGSNLFFWLFKSQRGNWRKRPVVVWLAGGPGSSSLIGLFVGQGPYKLTKANKLKRRRITLNRDSNILFIDSPVGAGFSFTNKDSGYARTDADAAHNLYEGLSQFYQLFPALRRNKLFISGVSYGGKFVVAVGYKIYKMNKASSFKMPLAGLSIGDGFVSFGDTMHYASFFYEIGLIDSITEVAFKAQEERVRNDMKAGDILKAKDDYNHYFNAIMKTTGLRHYFNFVHDEISASGPERNFLSDTKTKEWIHVGDHVYHNGSEVKKFMGEGFMVSVRPWLEELLTAEEFPILSYSGQLDVAAPYYVALKLYETLNFPGAKDYHTTKRCHFKVEDHVAGYFKTAGTLTEVLIRNAGHVISIEQRKWAYALLNRFITNSTSFRCD